MSRILHTRRLAAILLALACETESPRAEAGSSVDTLAAAPVRADSFTGVPDSAWIDVPRPTLIAFFPRASNGELERDRDLAELLDHLSFNLGTATDSLEARGLRVTMRSGDTLWLRAGAKKWRFIRAADSALVGFYVTSPDGRHIVRYGSGTEFSLLELADRFLRPAPTQ